MTGEYNREDIPSLLLDDGYRYDKLEFGREILRNAYSKMKRNELTHSQFVYDVLPNRIDPVLDKLWLIRLCADNALDGFS